MSDLIVEDALHNGDQTPWTEYVIAGRMIFLSRLPAAADAVLSPLDPVGLAEVAA